MLYPPQRPLDDTAIPGMAPIKRFAKRRNWGPEELGWEEDAIARWRALGVFGAMIIFEGSLLAWAGAAGQASGAGWVLGAVGIFVLLLGVLVTPAFGGEYAAAVLGGAAVAIGLGMYLIQNPTAMTLSLRLAWAGGGTYDPWLTGPVVLSLTVGAILTTVGVFESLLVARRWDAEPALPST